MSARRPKSQSTRLAQSCAGVVGEFIIGYAELYLFQFTGMTAESLCLRFNRNPADVIVAV